MLDVYIYICIPKRGFGGKWQVFKDVDSDRTPFESNLLRSSDLGTHG